MLKFNAAYRVKEGNSEFYYVAVGAYPNLAYNGIQYIIPGSYERNIIGNMSKTGPDSYTLITEQVGKEVPFVFEYLTLERFYEMQQDITGFENIQSGLKTTADVQSFYVHSFIYKEWEADYLALRDHQDQ